jgi:patatin-like phospholipase/acyl hydrolase
MRPFREHVAIAIDGGGIRGVMVARALAILEEHLGQSSHETFRLAAGTSTGSIISAGIGAGLSGAEMHRLYEEFGGAVFRTTWRTLLWPLTRYRYPHGLVEELFIQHVGDITMGDLWSADPPTDVVITVFDLVDNRTRFLKPYKTEERYDQWPVVMAVLASCSVPTFFPPVAGRYVDGGVGSYANPCYLAAYEAIYCLGWAPSQTTLISLGTGRNPNTLRTGDADRFWAWNWLGRVLGAFLQSADDQQVHLVDTFFKQLDFRRFQVDLREPIEMDDASSISQLTVYGDELGRKIINDDVDRAQGIEVPRAPRRL